MHILLGAQTLFSLWMLADAAQRRAGTMWFFIILMPFGSIVYFFMVKIHDPEMRAIKGKLLTKRISLKELEYNARATPSLHNRLLLAQGLYDNQRYEDARALFAEILQQEPGDKKALHGMGLCLLHLRRSAEAITALEQVVARDFGWSDYSPCADLALLYWEEGRKDDTVQLLERVVQKSKRLSHRTELARYLHKMDRSAEARQMLTAALEDYQNSPRYVRRMERRWAREAHALLRTLPARPS